MKRYLVAALTSFLAACGPPETPPDTIDITDTPETLSVEALASMEGSWTGTLTYLDYGDNETQVSLPVRAEFVRVNDTLVSTFFYTEPNGSIVDDRGTLVVGPAGTVVIGGNDFRVVESTRDASGQLSQLVLTERGSDSGQPALLTRSFSIEADEFRIRQDVLLDGDSVSFTRNEHVFRRPQ